jgi:hypothetical protein
MHDDKLQLVEFFRRKTSAKGKEIALNLTDLVNQALCNDSLSVEVPSEFKGSVIERMLNGPISPISASVFWQAFHSSRLPGETQFENESSGITNILATIPSEYRVPIDALPNIIAPYEGSLLNFLSELIDSANHELIVVAPYWSKPGIESVIRRLKSRSKPELEVLIMVPAEMSESNLIGLETFKDHMRDLGAKVLCISPQDLSTGSPPLVHAKAIISDGEHAYVGSANLSDNGLSRSIEVGIGIRGSEVKHLRNWFLKIVENFTIAKV